MSPQWLLYSYIAAGVGAMLMLLRLRSNRWYVHAIAALAGLAVGLLPPPAPGSDWFYLMAGVACVSLLVWGSGGLLLQTIARTKIRRFTLVTRY